MCKNEKKETGQTLIIKATTGLIRSHMDLFDHNLLTQCHYTVSKHMAGLLPQSTAT
jgi:hypothetical protein